VRYERRGATGWITFDRPAARNAMTFAMYEALHAHCERADADPEVRTLVLRGAGGAFVAGTDIAEFRAFESAEDGLRYEATIDRIVGRLEAVRKPTVALIDGYAVGGGLALAAVTGKAEIMDAVQPGGLGGTFGGNPVSCAAACVVLDELARPSFRPRAEEVGSILRSALDELARKHEAIGEVRGLGPMLALELESKSAEDAKNVTVAARERGLVLLSCGLYGNVIRLVPPLTVTDDELARGLSILDEAFEAA
jgi:hypothetical protein